MRRYVLEAHELQSLFDTLHLAGYATVGPTLREETIIYDRIESVADLPQGWIDVQEAGSYAVQNTGNDRYFDHTVGPHAWRRFLRPPREELWSAEREAGGIEFSAPRTPTDQLALIGVRSCDLSALGVLDRVLTGQQHTDDRYGARRSNAFIVSAQCARAGATCFCASMDTGPRAESGFDLALTELDLDGHVFVVEVGSDRGAEVAASLPLRDIDEATWNAALAASKATAASMGRALQTDGLREMLLENLESPAWDDIAKRCLSCANCTMVCPTCFCTTTEVDTDLQGLLATHTQVWDSCFHADFTYMHGGAVRTSTKSRYRQWLTHKLATWHDQFQQSGCVGCGRCITWCPVGIDLTQTVAQLRQTEQT